MGIYSGKFDVCNHHHAQKEMKAFNLNTLVNTER